MRIILGTAAVLTALLSCSVGHTASSPNVVYILVDNWGWGDIGVQGSTVPTPRIDALAAQGMRLTNFNVQNQCTPTRSALHTGRLPIRSGTQKVAAPGEPDGMAPWEYTLPELLSDAGYATALFGKWHLHPAGEDSFSVPLRHGFDHYDGHPGNFVKPDGMSSWRRGVNGSVHEEKRYATTVEVDAFLDWWREICLRSIYK